MFSAPLFIYNVYYSLFGIFMTTSRLIVVATTGSIFVLSVNRFVSMVRPMRYPNIMTFKRTVTMVALVWLFAIIVLVLAMVGLILDIKPMMYITCYFNAFYIASSTVNVYVHILFRQETQRTFGVTDARCYRPNTGDI